MKKYLRNVAKGLVLAGVAITVGVGIAMADADDSYYSTGSAGSPLSGGNLAVIAGDGAEPGNLSVAGSVLFGTASDDLSITHDTFGTGNDWFLFGSGNELLYFGDDTQDDDAGIWFELTSGTDPDDDGIVYTAGSDTDDDTLFIASDDVIVEANHGDVVIHLGD